MNVPILPEENPSFNAPEHRLSQNSKLLWLSITSLTVVVVLYLFFIYSLYNREQIAAQKARNVNFPTQTPNASRVDSFLPSPHTVTPLRSSGNKPKRLRLPLDVEGIDRITFQPPKSDKFITIFLSAHTTVAQNDDGVVALLNGFKSLFVVVEPTRIRIMENTTTVSNVYGSKATYFSLYTIRQKEYGKSPKKLIRRVNGNIKVKISTAVGTTIFQYRNSTKVIVVDENGYQMIIRPDSLLVQEQNEFGTVHFCPNDSMLDEYVRITTHDAHGSNVSVAPLARFAEIANERGTFLVSFARGETNGRFDLRDEIGSISCDLSNKSLTVSNGYSNFRMRDNRFVTIDGNNSTLNADLHTNVIDPKKETFPFYVGLKLEDGVESWTEPLGVVYQKNGKINKIEATNLSTTLTLGENGYFELKRPSWTLTVDQHFKAIGAAGYASFLDDSFFLKDFLRQPHAFVRMSGAHDFHVVGAAGVVLAESDAVAIRGQLANVTISPFRFDN